MNRDELRDLVQAIEWRCQIFKVLDKNERYDLIPTVLEDLAEDSQAIALDYCSGNRSSDEMPAV